MVMTRRGSAVSLNPTGPVMDPVRRWAIKSRAKTAMESTVAASTQNWGKAPRPRPMNVPAVGMSNEGTNSRPEKPSNSSVIAALAAMRMDCMRMNSWVQVPASPGTTR
jgi:hypothetical protein